MNEAAIAIHSISGGRRANQDTIETLEFLLAQARSGQMQGMAVISLYGTTRYDFHLTGQAENHPGYTLGLMCKFKHEIADAMD